MVFGTNVDPHTHTISNWSVTRPNETTKLVFDCEEHLMAYVRVLYETCVKEYTMKRMLEMIGGENQNEKTIGKNNS